MGDRALVSVALLGQRLDWLARRFLSSIDRHCRMRCGWLATDQPLLPAAPHRNPFCYRLNIWLVTSCSYDLSFLVIHFIFLVFLQITKV